MLSLFPVLFANAVLILPLFVLCWVLARRLDRPPVVHAFWVLLLLKLFTPPLVSIPAPEWIASLAQVEPDPQPSSLPPNEEHADSSVPDTPPAVASAGTDEDTSDDVTSSKQRTPQIPSVAADFPAENLVSREESTESTTAESAVVDPLAMKCDCPPASAEITTLEPDTSDTIPEAGGASIAAIDDLSEHTEVELVAESRPAVSPLGWRFWLIAVWLAGAFFVCLRSAIGLVRFRLRTRQAVAADEELTARVRSLATTIGLRNGPRVKVWPGVISPMVWTGAGRPWLILPSGLLERLTPEQLETVVLHELAHLKRRDHWVRLLDLAAKVVYWWHPLVWLAGAELRRAEEECCDALVVAKSGAGERTYAEALVETVAFLSRGGAALPPLASGMGRIDFLQRRITKIMQPGRRGQLTWRSRLSVLLVAAIVLPTSLLMTGATADEEAPSDAAVVGTTDDAGDDDPSGVAALISDPTLVCFGGYATEPEPLVSVDPHVHAVAISPDGKIAVAGHGHWVGDGLLRIWNLEEKTVLHERSLRRGVSSIDISPDGQLCAFIDWTNAFRVVDLQSFADIHTSSVGGRVARLAFAPDSKQLVTASESGQVRVYDCTTWEFTEPFEKPLYRLQDAAWSPDGKTIVVTGGYFKAEDGHEKFGRATVIDAVTKEIRGDIGDFGMVGSDVTISADSRLAAVTTFGQDLILIDLSGEKPRQLAATKVSSGSQAAIFHPSPDNQSLFVADRSGRVQTWTASVRADNEEGERVTLERTKLQQVSSGGLIDIAMTAGGKIVTGGDKEDHRFYLVGLGDGMPTCSLVTESQTVDEHSAVLGVAVAPDESLMVTLHEDGSIRIRDAESGRVVRRLEGHQDLVTCAVFTPDGRLLLTGSYDRTLILWDVATGRPLRTFEGHTNWVNAAVVLPDGKTIASGGYDRTVRLWDLATGRLLATLSGHRSAVRCLTTDSEGKTLYSGSSDSDVIVWDVESRSETQRWTDHRGAVRAVSLSSDESRFASAGEDGTIILRDPTSGAVARKIEADSGIVWSMRLTPDGTHVIGGELDGKIRVWNCDTGEVTRTLESHDDAITALTIAPRSQTLVSSSYDEQVLRWSASERAIRPLAAHHFPFEVRFAHFDEERNRLTLAGSNDALFQVNLQTGKVISKGKKQPGVQGGEVSPDGKQVAFGGWQKNILVVDADSYKPVHKFEGHEERVNDVAYLGDKLLSASHDGTVGLWDAANGKLLRKIPVDGKSVSSVTVTPDNSLVIATTGHWRSYKDGGSVVFFDAQTFEPVLRYSVEGNDVKNTLVTSDGSRAFSYAAGRFDRFDLAERKHLGTWKAGFVVLRAVLIDDESLLLCGREGQLVVVDPESGTTKLRFQGHDGVLSQFAYVLPDGSGILTGAQKGQLRVWPLITTSELESESGRKSDLASVLGCEGLPGPKIEEVEVEIEEVEDDAAAEIAVPLP